MAETVLITGASQGIGLATTKLLSESGVAVIGIARSEPEDKFPGHFYSVDLSDREKTAQAMEQIIGEHDVEGVVNNVGLNKVQWLGEVELDAFDQVIDLNLRVAIQITQAILPQMRSRKYGRIVNISSRGALGREGRTSYGAAKAGLIGMTRTWALELAEAGITANIVSPGPTATEMFRGNNLTGPGAEERKRAFLADVPMNRFGEVEEIAFAISVFLDRRASFMTGQVLNVCGGSSVGVTSL